MQLEIMNPQRLQEALNAARILVAPGHHLSLLSVTDCSMSPSDNTEGNSQSTVIIRTTAYLRSFSPVVPVTYKRVKHYRCQLGTNTLNALQNELNNIQISDEMDCGAKYLIIDNATLSVEGTSTKDAYITLYIEACNTLFCLALPVKPSYPGKDVGSYSKNFRYIHHRLWKVIETFIRDKIRPFVKDDLSLDPSIVD